MAASKIHNRSATRSPRRCLPVALVFPLLGNRCSLLDPDPRRRHRTTPPPAWRSLDREPCSRCLAIKRRPSRRPAPLPCQAPRRAAARGLLLPRFSSVLRARRSLHRRAPASATEMTSMAHASPAASPAGSAALRCCSAAVPLRPLLHERARRMPPLTVLVPASIQWDRQGHV